MTTRIRSALTDPDIMFSQNLMENPVLAPQLSDPDRIASIKAYAKGTFPDRKPDISTPRTDVSIIGWEEGPQRAVLQGRSAFQLNHPVPPPAERRLTVAITQVNAPFARTMFVEDIIADSSLGPQLSDPDRIPHIEVHYKGRRSQSVNAPPADYTVEDPGDSRWISR